MIDLSTPVIDEILLASASNPAAAGFPPDKGPKNAYVAPTIIDAPSL